MADAGSPWSAWGGLAGTMATAISIIVGAVIGVFGLVWRGGRATAFRLAKEQRKADEVAELAVRVAKHDALERRVFILEGQQTMLTSCIDGLSREVVGMRHDMAAGFEGLRSRQDRMLEKIAERPVS